MEVQMGTSKLDTTEVVKRIKADIEALAISRAVILMRSERAMQSAWLLAFFALTTLPRSICAIPCTKKEARHDSEI
jgi:hypothetical protein